MAVIDIIYDVTYCFNDLYILSLTISTHIVGFTQFAEREDSFQCAAVILYVQPVANVLSLSINRDWLVL